MPRPSRSTDGRKTTGWFWWAFASLPAGLAVIGVVLLVLTLNGTRNAQPVTAEVVLVEKVWSRGGPNRASELRYRVRFRYDAPWGAGLFAEPRTADDSYDFEVGETVPILVDPARPDRAWVAGLWSLYGDAIGMILGGLGFLWLTVWVRRRYFS